MKCSTLLTLGLLVVAGAISGCSVDANTGATSTPAERTLAPAVTPASIATATAVSPTASVSREGCEPRPAPNGGTLVSDPNGPYGHQVVIARTTDGTTLTGATQVLDHASVPDAVALADGRVLIYYVSGETGAIHVARVEGNAVEPLGQVVVDGVVAPVGAVDPDAMLLPDGRVRLHYLGNLGPASPGATKTWYMCAADSRDGVHFTLVGRVAEFTGEATTDPSVTRLADGAWLMAVSQGQHTVFARSIDGVRYEPYATVDFGGVPEIAALPDGRVRLYVCARGIESYLSGDGGQSWTKEATNIAPALGKRIVCDPSWVPAANLFVYKTG